MERFWSVLLRVWQEACRHIEIHESAQIVTPLLLPYLPMAQLLVRRFDLPRGCLETLAVGLSDPNHPVPADRSEIPASQLPRLVAWCKRGQVARRGDKVFREAGLPSAIPSGVQDDVLVTPLGDPEGVGGLLVLPAQARRTYNARHVALAQALREPFAVALANHHQIHELATLREAAEAEKRSLLTRLGRKQPGDTIVGAESGLRAAMERVERVSSSDVPVLIFGETGTGKELVARAIHTRSRRSAGPIHRVNCGAIPPELIDSELFGHERGAFTGAVGVRKGWFERADGGTLFLDEIGDLSPHAQVRLLRVVQDGWLERVGGHQPIHADVRIVAATHRDLPKMVAEGRFREDLWYRISVFPIVLPPLRERTEDIPEMARHFADRAATRFGLPPVMPSVEDLELLVSYSWPGNARELAAVMDRATILGDGRCLEVARALGVPAPIPARPVAEGKTEAGTPPLPAGILPLDTAMKQHIETALSATKGRIEGPRGVARLLGINPHTLRARMRKLGVEWRKFRRERRA